MTDGQIPSFIAGLTAGIVVIVLFSIAIRSDYNLSDDELIARYNKIPAINYFLTKYPDATISVDRYDNGKPTVAVSYMVERQVDSPTRFDSGRHSLYLSVIGQPLRYQTLVIGCGYGGMTISTQLMNIEMIDSTARICLESEA